MPAVDTEEVLRDRLHVMLSEWDDAPLADLGATMAMIRGLASPMKCSRLNDWIDRQQVCTVIVKHHGRAALTELIRAIAEASIRLKVSMSSRVQSIADFYELE